MGFPAVTLCNINKVYKPAIATFIEKLVLRGLTEERVEQFFSNLSKLVQPEYVDDVFPQTLTILKELNYTTEKLINNEVDSVFEQLDDPVHRVSGAGQFVSLEVLLHVSVAQYVAYTRSYYGISVLIHSPEDYPQASATTTIAQPGCDVILAIIPSVVVSEPSVRTLALKQRNCFFQDEKKLRTTEKYSFQSCITECAVDTIVKQCGCLPFYYSEIHLKDFAGKTRQCNLQDVGCLRDNRHIISSLQPLSVTNETVGMKCPGCLPSCSEERYGVQSIIAKRYEADNLISSYGKNLTNHVTLKVHFKDVTCLKYRRDIFMTWDVTTHLRCASNTEVQKFLQVLCTTVLTIIDI
ncbi:Pickpocket protein 28 [Pseudolycoriella hygida]|uniref:Pickpocket protein 28 n=1 Tax=Pseudolycoriella hygida TaxID=35572 RepID=A0A9Q0S3X0_9DIPT|nr:Pickpocket protein 28 [Pseudolycoriella hygida]